MIGKFENEEVLLKSYNDLEKEFTKKCQELSRLKKVIESEQKEEQPIDATLESGVDVETMNVDEAYLEEEGEELGATREFVQEDCVPLESEIVLQDNCAIKSNKEIVDIDEQTQIEDKAIFGVKFRAMASEFLRNNADAGPYAKEISKILLKDKSILSCSDPFGVAYALALKNGKSEAKNETNVELKEEKAVNVQEKSRIPTTIGVLGKSSVGFSPSRVVSKFRTMEDARSELLRRFG